MRRPSGSGESGRRTGPACPGDRAVRRSPQGTFVNTHMEGGLSTAQGVCRPAVCGVRVGGGAHRLSSTSVSRLICAGWCRMTGVRGEERCRSLWRRAWPGGLLAVFSRVAPRVVAPVRSPRRAVWWWRLLHRRECPSVSGEFAGDGDHDHRAGLASALERVPAFVEAAGAAVRLGSHGEGLACASASSVTLIRGGRRWCQVASIRSRRACVLPALVIAPCGAVPRSSSRSG
jgi:hypothetical protein